MNLRNFLTAGAAAMAGSLLMAAGPAQARDDALLRAMAHCGTLNDTAKRLDCYDALAPRVQAALSAPPAAASAPAPQVATKAPPTKEEQESWFGLGDLFSSSPDRQTTPKEFGADKLPAPKQTASTPAAPQPIDSITAKVTDYAFNGLGKFVVFLDNGQVWKQLQGDSDNAHFRRKASSNTVTISRGFLGSYNLKVNDDVGIYKVTRIK